MAECSCQAGEIVLFPCSGGSNVGQIANAAAVQLTRDGRGRMYCLAGVGGDISGIVESTKSALVRVAIDGCAIGCAQATLRRIGVEPEVVLVLTDDLNIEKNKNFDLSQDDIKQTCEELKARIPQPKSE